MFFELTEKAEFKSLNHEKWLINASYWLQKNYIHFGLKEFLAQKLDEIVKSKYQQEEELSILDVGCGSGWVVDVLPSEKLSYLGIDFIPQFISSLKQRHKDSPNINFKTVDIEEDLSMNGLPASQIVVCCLTLIETAYLGEVFSNLKKLTTDNGTLLIIGLNPYSEMIRYSLDYQEVGRIFNFFRKSHFPIVLSKKIKRGKDISPEEYFRILYDVDDYIKYGKQVGFQIEEVSEELNRHSEMEETPMYNFVLMSKK